MDAAEDTETLLALVSSLLTIPVPNQSVILDSLVHSNGDVQAAADSLNRAGSKDKGRQRTPPSRRKRRAFDLDGWLKPSSTTDSNAEGTPDRKKRVKEDDDDEFSLVVASSSKLKDINKTATNSSPSKPVIDLMSVLRQPPPSVQKVPRLPPLTLSNPSLVSQHTPCTMHLSILPPELACKLFYTMIDLSQDWNRNKWWLFDRVVESPHRTSFYARKTDGVDTDESWQEAAQFWYNGRQTDAPEVFPDVMEEACQYIERVVNEEMRKRDRYPLEWAGKGTEGQIWRANVAASNRYEGAKESVGFHSDQMTYLGPYPTIASLSLGTARVFRLREVIPSDEVGSRYARTFNIPLAHNSMIIMHASTQERFKHSIPPQPTLDVFRPLFPRDGHSASEPSNCRINITFRFYRPDFPPKSIPRCKCGVPTVLRADMKNRQDGKTDRYWWSCYAGAQNDGKGCDFWRVMDMKAEGRGPTIEDTASDKSTTKPGQS